MKFLCSLLVIFLPSFCFANGKILATPGVSQIEGAGGGGLVPWAQLAGYATEDEIAGAAFCSKAHVSDFRLDTCGAQLNLYDRFELSFAKQDFEVEPLSLTLSQEIVGAKVRLYGDLVYSEWPQLTFGVLHKRLQTPDVAYALGANKDTGTDLYIAASKLHLGALAGYSFLWNATLRYSSANEMGLLGFSHDKKLLPEAAVALLLNKHLAVGAEYRTKPHHLAVKESDWHDVFIAWFPNKHINLTLAYLDLGTIANVNGQHGWYFSISGQL